MKKVLTVFTLAVFCMAALSLQATDKNNKKNANNKKVTVSKALTTATNSANAQLKGQTAVFYEDIKGRNSKKEK